MTTTFTFNRGEPIRVDLVDVDGAYTGATVTMKIKEADANKPPPKSAATKVVPVVTYVAADGAEPAYWKAEVAGSITADWKAGVYVMDAMISVSGTVTEVTEYALIRLSETVTP
jgi:hypothetical protein